MHESDPVSVFPSFVPWTGFTGYYNYYNKSHSLLQEEEDAVKNQFLEGRLFQAEAEQVT